MNKITTKVVGRSALAAALSLGLSAGIVGVASASTVTHHPLKHADHEGRPFQHQLRGVVSAYTAGSSISITAPGASTPTVYTLTSATTIVGLASGATLAPGAHVGLVLSSTTPATVTTILVGMRGEGEGFGHPGSNMPGMNMGGFNHDGNNGRGSSQRGGGRR